MTAARLDVRELQCTQAVMALLRALVPLADGDELEVRWEDPAAHRDLLAVIARRGHALVRDEQAADGNRLVVRK